MPIPRKRPRKKPVTALVRVNLQSVPSGGKKTQSGTLHRSGVLCQPEQRQIEDEKELLKLCVAFLQELVRHTVASDALVLSMYAAKRKVNPSQVTLERFANAVAGEHTKRYFPEGF